VFLPVRYADDFVVLVSGTQADALAEKSALAEYLRRTTGLELAPEKTRVTAVTDGFEFLGFHVTMRWNERYGYGPRVEIPKAKAVDLRRKVKQLTGAQTTLVGLGEKLREINPILRGWANYYRYCPYAGKVFSSLDWYISDRLWRWQRKKRPTASAREILAARQPSSLRRTRRLWREGPTEQHLLSWTPIGRYRLAWMKTPNFAMSSGELDA
jgi:RNA-directed DNA polymerase